MTLSNQTLKNIARKDAKTQRKASIDNKNSWIKNFENSATKNNFWLSLRLGVFAVAFGLALPVFANPPLVPETKPLASLPPHPPVAARQ